MRKRNEGKKDVQYSDYVRDYQGYGEKHSLFIQCYNEQKIGNIS